MTATKPLALVTGASGGIGEELAYRFAEGGYDLVLVARSADKLAAVAGRAQAKGATCTILQQDLQAPGAGAALEAAVAKRGLTVDVLVNNAGFGIAGDFLDVDLEQELGTIDLDVRVLAELTHRFGRGMRERRRGGILNVASTAAFQPGPGMTVYCAAKAFVLSFTEALNQELRGTGVHATALCPGPVLTGFQARGEFGDDVRLMKMMPLTTAEMVARMGYDGFKAKKRVVIPGIVNLIVARSSPFTPRGLLLTIGERLMRKAA
jgi:hypothetical protein